MREVLSADWDVFLNKMESLSTNYFIKKFMFLGWLLSDTFWLQIHQTFLTR